ncbi:hypothetical protein BCV02_13030 [Vibrio breoganii]|uniref:L-threonine 3-dehydrogenase n=2 Tax=Vibrio breoganii TaxID=553239 RepID=A0AAP8MTR4_9VIBR|nr:hypothetical protein BCV02_13030 [Vibrio breoganii]PML88408.1 hypothetical protein BCT67_09840 [Vibrio breoganii]PMO80696.1 hypothetical protein BCT02_03690 [Vibrio breoganii]PMO86147.1 hypothetical protein BCS99_12205 [Vibrio breoganii]PMP07446.1 hypothetical protein BCS93_15945 [Vibrio breoganii]
MMSSNSLINISYLAIIPTMFETWYKMASLIQSGLDLSPIITHHYKVEDFQEGFDVMRSGQSGKVNLDWE